MEMILAWLSQYWWAVALAIIAIVFIVIAFVGNNKKMKQTLLYLVTTAEKELGSGTGALKLQSVYNKFIEKFPIISTFVPYATFTKLVDDALSKMKTLLEENPTIKEYVETKEG